MTEGVTIQVSEEDYWDMHDDIQKRFKSAYPKMRELNRSIYFWNQFMEVLSKKDIFIEKVE